MLLGRWLAATTFFVIAPWCAAEDAIPSDFTQGFEQLAKLGLPAIPAGTKWAIFADSDLDIYSHNSELLGQMKGNGWHFPTTKDGEHTALLPGEISLKTFVAEVNPPPQSGGLLGGLFGNNGDSEPTIKRADLTKDLKSVRAELQRQSKKRSADDHEREYSDEDSNEIGRLLIFATQIFQQGDTILANDLATALFQTYPEDNIVVDAALNYVANAEYELVTSAVFETQDWKTYHGKVESLVEKFPRGWKNQSAAKFLLDSLANRAAEKPPLIPKLVDIEIDPRAIESVSWMIEALAETKTQPTYPPEVAATLAQMPKKYHAQYLGRMGLQGASSVGNLGTWLLADSKQLKATAGVAMPTVQLGLAALPVLAALVEDPYLTIYPNPTADGYIYQSPDQSEEERLLYNLSSMKRPATRGDLAQYMLTATLPSSDEYGRKKDAQTLRESALEFWNDHKNDTREQLSLAFLEKGSSEQKTEAAKLLANSKNPADHKALQKQILAEQSPISQLEAVKSYITVRKSAARPFLTLYIKALREELGDKPNFEELSDLPYEIRKQGSIEPTIKDLESKAAGESPQSQARKIANQDPKAAIAALPAFIEGLSDAPPRRLQLALLAGAVAAKNPEVRAHFLNSLNEQANAVREKREITLSPEEITAWKTLRSDTRQVPAAISLNQGGVVNTMGEFAAMTLDRVATHNDFPIIIKISAITGKTYEEVQILRADARLSGTPVEIPDGSKISQTRLSEIVTTAGKISPMEIHSYLKTLNHEERAAWRDWWSSPGDIAVPLNVQKLALTVTERWKDLFKGYKDMPEIMGIGVGFQLSKDSITEIIERMGDNVTEHSRSIITIGFADFPPGLKILTTKHDIPKINPAESADENNAKITDIFSVREIFRGCLSNLKLSEVPKTATGVIHICPAQGSDEDLKSSWYILDRKVFPIKSDPAQVNFLGTIPELGDTISWPFFEIQVLSRADALALKEPE